eukprot:gb/GECG01012043.1/.p1 GENE.gb/GECG01012043.1/~~gb/GECG01012043.1/.p1  ORF type:complete len:553 (+),score=87.60 gb/GECG01012043.1/:1-1659(+)
MLGGNRKQVMPPARERANEAQEAKEDGGAGEANVHQHPPMAVAPMSSSTLDDDVQPNRRSKSLGASSTLPVTSSVPSVSESATSSYESSISANHNPRYYSHSLGVAAAAQFNNYYMWASTYGGNGQQPPNYAYPVSSPYAQENMQRTQPSSWFVPTVYGNTNHTALQLENMELRRQVYAAHAALANMKRGREAPEKSKPNKQRKRRNGKVERDHADASSDSSGTASNQIVETVHYKPSHHTHGYKPRAKAEGKCSFGYRGVYCRSGRWNAQIQYAGRKMYLGVFSSQVEAAKAYDEAAIRYHGPGAFTNFDYRGTVLSRGHIHEPEERHAHSANGNPSTPSKGDSSDNDSAGSLARQEEISAAQILSSVMHGTEEPNERDDASETMGGENTPGSNGVPEKRAKDCSAQSPSPNKIRGRLEDWEKELTTNFVTEVIDGRRTVYKGDLARAMLEYVNPRREKASFEKLVSRRQLNTRLAEYMKERSDSSLRVSLCDSTNAPANSESVNKGEHPQEREQEPTLGKPGESTKPGEETAGQIGTTGETQCDVSATAT